jgi:hypothetical protein
MGTEGDRRRVGGGWGGGGPVARPDVGVHPQRAPAAVARRRAVRPSHHLDQPRRHHPGPTRPGVAVAGADGLAPRRLVHGSLGRPTAVPGQLAQRQRAPPRPAAAAAGRRPHPRRTTRDGLVRGRPPGPAEPAGAALHHPPARQLAGTAGCRHRLGMDLRPRPDQRRRDPPAPAGPGPDRAVVADRRLHGGDRPRRPPHGRQHAEGHPPPGGAAGRERAARVLAIATVVGSAGVSCWPRALVP